MTEQTIPMQFFFRANCLVVDDEPIARKLSRETLLKLGFKKIFTTDNGRKALEIIASNRIDLAIVDINMPFMNGIELYEAVRRHERFDEIVFIFVTAESEKHKVAQLLEESADAYLLKPFSLKDLEDTILATLRRVLKPSKVKELRKDFRTAMNKNNIQLAQSVLNQIRDIVDNEDWTLSWLSGEIYLALGLPEQAVESLKNVIQKRPFYTKGYDLLAIAYDNLGNTDLAIEQYEKSHGINPGNRERVVTLTRLYRQVQRSQNAIDIAAAYKKGFISLAKEYMHMEGEILLTKGDINGSIEWLNRALAIDQEDPLILQTASASYAKAQDYSMAIETYLAAIKVQKNRPKLAKMCQILGEMYLQAGQPSEAAMSYKRSYELNPSDRLVIKRLRELMKDEGVRL